MTKKNSKEYAKICPRCGSIKIQTDYSNPIVWTSGANVKYKCESCGHLSSFFPEVEENEIARYKSKLSKELKEKHIKQEPEDIVDAKTGYLVGMYDLIIILICIVFAIVVLVLSK